MLVGLDELVSNWVGDKRWTVTTDNPYAGGRCIESGGIDDALKWEQKQEGLSVSLPSKEPCKYAYVLKITCKGNVKGFLDK